VAIAIEETPSSDIIFTTVESYALSQGGSWLATGGCFSIEGNKGRFLLEM
jgi:hypothetical protein